MLATFSTGPNLWPKSLPNEQFETPIMEYRSRMVELAEVMVQILCSWPSKRMRVALPMFSISSQSHLQIPMRLLHSGPQNSIDQRQFGGI